MSQPAPSQRVTEIVLCLAPPTCDAHPPRHAHRTTVNADDVKLCCRRSPSLLEHISAQSARLRAAKEAQAGKEGGRKKGGKKGERPAPVPVETEDDNG